MVNVFIQTYGCQANIADSETMSGILSEEGYNLVNSIKEADVIVINSCAVKNATQSKIFHFIEKVPEEKKLVVGGCLTKVVDLKKKFENIKAVFDTNSISKINSIIESTEDYFSDKKEDRINIPVVRKNNEISIINIEQGCTNFCTFCATKLSRGNLKSYRIGDIKRAVGSSIESDCKIIYLTGQDTGAYGLDIKTDLPTLLNELITIEGNFKIRIGMMNPWHTKRILSELIEVYKNNKIIKFLHIPVQSGSDNLLMKMRRTRNIEDFRYIVKIFREKISAITISTDIIVGYPEETEEDFQLTIGLIKEIKPEVVNISKFSSRPGTYASKLKQLSSQIIDKRSVELTRIYKEIRTGNKENKLLVIS